MNELLNRWARATEFPPERHGERAAMVAQQLVARDIHDPRVLAAMGAVPRHHFTPAAVCAAAYTDEPLPIGAGQTIAQPYIVALMTQLLALGEDDRVLEIGTGCGYQTAVLATLVREVCSVEILPDLAQRARCALVELGVPNVELRVGDGRAGWPERAPFTGVIVTAAPRALAPAWVEQVAEGGRLVVPLGDRHEQCLHRFTKDGGRLHDEVVLAVRFVPLVAECERWRRGSVEEPA